MLSYITKAYNLETMNLDDNDNTNHYEGALLEEINDRLKGIQEGQVSLVNVPGDLAVLMADMKVVKADIKTIKVAVKGHTKDINNLESRVTVLEDR